MGPGFEPKQSSCRGLLTKHIAVVAPWTGIQAAGLRKGHMPHGEHETTRNLHTLPAELPGASHSFQAFKGCSGETEAICADIRAVSGTAACKDRQLAPASEDTSQAKENVDSK